MSRWRAGLNKYSYCAHACSTEKDARTLASAECRRWQGVAATTCLPARQRPNSPRELGLHRYTRCKSRRCPTTPCRMDASSSSRSLQADGGVRWGYMNHITTLQKKLVLSDWNWRKKEILKLNHRQNKQGKTAAEQNNLLRIILFQQTKLSVVVPLKSQTKKHWISEKTETEH